MKVYKRLPIQTGVAHQRILTLYDFIKAVQEELCPGENDLVTDIVMGSLKSGKVKFLKINRKPVEKL